MTALQITLIAAIVVPALAIVLWPLLGGRAAAAASSPARASDDRRLELEEEKSALYRALRELEFDHDAGHLSDPDYQGLRERYESRAGALITELDALGPRRAGPRRCARAGPQPRTAHGARVLDAAPGHLRGRRGGAGGLRRDHRRQRRPLHRARRDLHAARRPPPGAGPTALAGAGRPWPALEPGKPIPPEMLAGMLQAARQSLFEGRYSEAIAAYQAVLKRDERNVDAMTHLGLIVAVGGHADSALETFDKALKIDPKYAPAYLYRGQVLYEQKQDYAGAVASWERFLALVPTGEDRDRVAELMKRARSQQPPR